MNIFERFNELFEANQCPHCGRFLFEEISKNPEVEKATRALGDLVLKRNAQPAVMPNMKTLYSVDFSTSCPKRDAGHPCQYCYVDLGRERVYSFIRNCMERDGMTPQEVEQSIKSGTYVSGPKKGKKFLAPAQAKRVNQGVYNGEIKKLSKDKISKLNAMGGLRLFSSGDYRGGADEDRQLEQIFNDADAVGLKVKAITKQIPFIEKWSDRTSVTNLSIDNLNAPEYKELGIKSEAVDWETAKKLLEKYPKVRVRAVALNPKEVKMFNDMPWVTVVTLFHGSPAQLKAKGIEAVNMSWHDQVYKDLMQQIGAEAEKKFCCQGGECALCPVHCGAPVGDKL